MTSVHLPLDGIGTESLRSTNRVPGSAEETTQVLGTPALRDDHSTQVPAVVPRHDRRRHDRRTRDRRKQDLPVMLDTRSPHNRRTRARRQHDSQASSHHPKYTRGINIVI